MIVDHCNPVVKGFYNSLMMESFLYFSIARAMASKSISPNRIDSRDKQLIDHESHYVTTCGCPDKQILGNREKRLTHIFESKFICLILNFINKTINFPRFYTDYLRFYISYRRIQQFYVQRLFLKPQDYLTILLSFRPNLGLIATILALGIRIESDFEEKLTIEMLFSLLTVSVQTRIF